MQKLPKRSRKYGVGKEIGGAVYLHRLYVGLLPLFAQRLWEELQDQSHFTVVKYSERSKTVSFVETPDFDRTPEPEIGQVLTFKFSGEASRRKPLSDPYIYHHKWLFVMDDYNGFDIEESKRRSRLWLSLDGIDSRRIGKKSYWVKNVLPRIEQVDPDAWLSSREMAKRLGVSDCKLSHLRLAGELEFKKRGNAFFYRPPESSA